MVCVIAITSGKGGVGKSNITINLALALSQRQSRVCIIDADSALPDLNILLGVAPKSSLKQVLDGSKSINEIILEHASGISLVPAATGISNSADFSSAELQCLSKAFLQLENAYDHILVDTATGIDDKLLKFVTTSQYTIIVITPEPTSLADAFALLISLAKKQQTSSVYILVNKVKNYQTSRNVYQCFKKAVNQHQNIDIHYLGYLVHDKNMAKAVTTQNPIVSLYPESPVSCCFYALADVVKSRLLKHPSMPTSSQYWRSLAMQSDTGKQQKPDFEFYQNSAKQLIAFINQADISPEQAVKLTKPLLNAYLHKLHKTSETLYPALYNYLAKHGYPESEIKDLVFTLESIFEHTQGKPLRSNSHQIAKLLVDMQGSENKMQQLKKTLEKNYNRQFNKKLFDPVKGTVELIKKKEFTESEFAAIMLEFKQAYHQRFESEYQDNSDKFVAIIKQLLDKDSF